MSAYMGMCCWPCQGKAGGERSTSKSSANGVWQGETFHVHLYHVAWVCGVFSERTIDIICLCAFTFCFCFQILPGVRVIIVNPETRGPLGDSHLGEVRGGCEQTLCQKCSSLWTQQWLSLCFLLPKIWVNSPHTASGYYTIYGEESLQADHFNTKLSFGDPQTLWARTGYLGFVKRTELLDASGGKYTLTELKPWFLKN